MFGGLGQLIKQAQQIQQKIKKVNEELAQKQFTATSGSDAVKVTVNGNLEVLQVEIHPDVLGTQDNGLIQDLVRVAVNSAIQQAKQAKEQELERVTGLKMPGLTQIFGG